MRAQRCTEVGADVGYGLFALVWALGAGLVCGVVDFANRGAEFGGEGALAFDVVLSQRAGGTFEVSG